jgi:hypothetical protein
VLGADIDLFVHPAWQREATTLIGAMLAEGRARGWRWLRTELGVEDAEKREVLARAGFRETGRSPDALSIGERLQDVVTLRVEL